MKKSNFLNGAIIATAGIVICKIIGLVYVIPFYAMIGTAGGTLYSYAYSIYAIFLSLSTSGIPVAMSKIVSEYNTLGEYHTKEKAFKIGSTLIIGLGILGFAMLVIFAPTIATILKGGVEGGATQAQITLVVRVVASALLIVPLFSVTRGYLQGHKMIATASISNVLEQLVRVIALLGGSYLVIKVFHLSTTLAVCVAVFSATIGALVGYSYVSLRIRKNKSEFNKNAELKPEEKSVTGKEILKKILMYAIPFVMIDLIDSAYVVVDSVSIVRTLTSLGMSADNAEIVLSSIATWATKLDMIVISVAIGFVTSLIPHITSSFVKNDMEGVNRKYKQALEMLLLIVIPLTFGLAFLASPIWTVFYSHNDLSISVFTLYAFQALTYSIHWLLINLLQSLNKSKVTLITLLSALGVKIILNVPAMKYLPLIGIPAYQGSTIVTLVVQIGMIIFILLYLHKKFRLNLKGVKGNLAKILFSGLAMVGVLFILTNFIDINTTTKLSSLLVVIIYAAVGGIVYLGLTYKFGLLDKFIKVLKSKRQEN
jgi:O-antigen/teichoic acid export membrane protein